MCPLSLWLLISSGTKKPLRSRDVIVVKPECHGNCSVGAKVGTHGKAEIEAVCSLGAGRQARGFPSVS